MNSPSEAMRCLLDKNVARYTIAGLHTSPYGNAGRDTARMGRLTTPLKCDRPAFHAGWFVFASGITETLGTLTRLSQCAQ